MRARARTLTITVISVCVVREQINNNMSSKCTHYLIFDTKISLNINLY